MNLTGQKNLETLADVEQAFRASIVVPENKPAQQFFFCPVGLIGVGKTTTTKAISEHFGLVRVSSDELRKLLKENGFPYDSLKEIGARVVLGFANQGYSIALDMDCGNPQIIGLVQSATEKFKAKAIWVHITAPESLTFERFKHNTPSWLAANAQERIDNYLAQKETRLRENNTFDFFWTFDTSKPDIQEQIAQFCTAAEKYLAS